MRNRIKKFVIIAVDSIYYGVARILSKICTNENRDIYKRWVKIIKRNARWDGGNLLINKNVIEGINSKGGARFICSSR